MAKIRSESKNAPALDISNVVAAFSEAQVERFTKLSQRRLRYWAKTGFFGPSFVEERPRLPYSRLYSFRDVVALRTLEMLRIQNNVPLQHLRTAAKELSHLKDELWTSTKLYVADRRVVFVNPESEDLQKVVSKQYVLAFSLKEVIEHTERDVARLRERSPDIIGKIQRHRSIARNAWTIAGTRIAVGSIRRLSEDGYSTSQIIDEYPDLTERDVEAALAHDATQAA